MPLKGHEAIRSGYSMISSHKSARGCDVMLNPEHTRHRTRWPWFFPTNRITFAGQGSSLKSIKDFLIPLLVVLSSCAHTAESPTFLHPIISQIQVRQKCRVNRAWETAASTKPATSATPQTARSPKTNPRPTRKERRTATRTMILVSYSFYPPV